MTSPSSSRRDSERHMVQLDSLRAFAVFVVIIQHTFLLSPGWKPGRLGVRLFYVLSGFLITGILLRARAKIAKDGDTSHILRAFYARRFLRIFPLYYFILAVAAILALPGVSGYMVSCLTYTVNFRSALDGTFLPMPIGHFWSLAVEEQFYLFWPLLMLMLPVRWLLPVIVSTLFIGPLSRLLFYRFVSGVAWEAATTSCLDTLGAGALLAYYSTSCSLPASTAKRLSRLALAGGLALAAFVVFCRVTGRMNTPSLVVEDTTYALLFGWLVSRAAKGFGGLARHILEFRPLIYLGTISYGIYVYHNFIPMLAHVVRDRLGIETGLPADEGVLLCCYVTVMTIAVSALSWHLFEKPLNQFKDYFPYIKRPIANPLETKAGREGSAARLPYAETDIRPLSSSSAQV